MRGVTAVGVYVPVIKGFQPALPMRGVTPHEVLQPVVVQISTRTPHAGSDSGFNLQWQVRNYFNPHSPCGE